MSKRRKEIPSTSAKRLATSVLPTPVGQQEGPYRLLSVAQAGAGDLDRRDQPLDRLVLAEDVRAQLLLQLAELLLVVPLDPARRHLRHDGEHLLQVRLGHLLGVSPPQSHRGAGLVEQVDRLVRELAVLQIAVGEQGGVLQRVLGVGDAVVLLVALLEAEEDPGGLLGGGLGQLDLLEAAGERLVAGEGLAVLLPGGGADAAQRAVLEGGLEQVRGVHGAAAGAPGAHDGVDLVDEEHRAVLLGEGRQHRLQPVLEVAAVAGAGDQRAHVQPVDLGVAERLGDLPLGDPQRQTLDQGGLADAGVAHVDRIVLPPPLEDVEGAQDLLVAADQRIDGALAGEVGQVLGEGLERIALRGAAAPAGLLVVLVLLPAGRLARAFAIVGGAVVAGDAVGDVANHVEPGDPLALQHLDGVGVPLVEHRHQDVGAGELLAANAVGPGGGEREDALHAQGEAGLAAVLRQRFELLGEVLGECLAHPVEVRAGVLEHLGGLLVEGEGVEQMLQPGVFMAHPSRLGDGDGEGDLQVVGNFHSSSLPSAGSALTLSGMPFARASSVTSATLVSATSLE
jgi:hypothetical protein